VDYVLWDLGSLFYYRGYARIIWFGFSDLRVIDFFLRRCAATLVASEHSWPNIL
jgi:hypothetical protein